MIEQTTYLNEESERKQVTMPVWAYNWLKEEDEGTMTKGLKAYESLMFKFDEYEDSLTKIENSVDSRLSSLGSPELVTSILKIKNGPDVIDYENSDRASHVNIHLPVSLMEQLTVQRGVGDHIAEAVEEIAQSVYDDRMDRIRVKQQIADYVEHGQEPSHDIAQAIVNGEGEKFQTAHEQLMKYTGGEVETEELQVRDDITIDELEEVEHSADGQGWSQKQRDERIKGLETAVRNEIKKEDVDEYKFDAEKLTHLAQDIFDVGEATAQSYVDDIEIDWIDTVHFDPQEMASIRKEMAIADIEKSPTTRAQQKINKIRRIPRNEIVLIDMDLPAGGEMAKAKAEEIAEEILDNVSFKYRQSPVGTIQEEAHEKFVRLVKQNSGIIEQ